MLRQLLRRGPQTGISRVLFCLLLAAHAAPVAVYAAPGGTVTPLANTGDTDSPNASPASTAVTDEVAQTKGTKNAPTAASTKQGVQSPSGAPAETLIADFRWGQPQMGRAPHLPIPKPVRPHSEDGAGAALADNESVKDVPPSQTIERAETAPAPSTTVKPASAERTVIEEGRSGASFSTGAVQDSRVSL